ncbi:MAG: hypothetical protein K2J33_07050, partial [Alistipes sp.]|nr:hypothetical protein [Alistipes sp.]
MLPLRTTDNNCGACSLAEEHRADLAPIADRTVRALCAENPDLLVFPHSIDACRDGSGDSPIFTLRDDSLTT